MLNDNQSSLNSPEAGRLILRPDAGPSGDVLVAIFLRGGMDGVYTVPPLGDRAFGGLRTPLLRQVSGQASPVPLDGFFALHPDFAHLEPLYRRKQLAIVHAAGLNEPLLSHFDAMRAVERGVSADGPENGWIGRHLAARQPSHPSQLRAVAMGKYVPLVLRGTEARSFDLLSDIRLNVPLGWNPSFFDALKMLYASGDEPMTVAGRGMLQTLGVLEKLAKSPYQPENDAGYAADTFGNQMRQVAQLIKAEVGLEAAVLVLDGWDSHVSQAQYLARPMQSLARSLSGFAQDMGDGMHKIVVLLISEFGRRVAPNDAGGTDHGRGTAMLVIGGGIRGGKVYGRWPGLAEDELDEQGNLRVTTDYRNVLAEIVERRLQNTAIERVFPGLQPEYLQFTA